MNTRRCFPYPHPSTAFPPHPHTPPLHIQTHWSNPPPTPHPTQPHTSSLIIPVSCHFQYPPSTFLWSWHWMSPISRRVWSRGGGSGGLSLAVTDGERFRASHGDAAVCNSPSRQARGTGPQCSGRGWWGGVELERRCLGLLGCLHVFIINKRGPCQCCRYPSVVDSV